MSRPILIVGSGSVGQRHARNLRRLTSAPLISFRATDRDARSFERECDITPFRDLDEALAQSPRLAIIANPTSAHLPAAIAAARSGCHLFIEKPLSHSLEGVDELRSAVDAAGVKVVVGCVMRFHPVVRAVERALRSGAVGHAWFANVQAGQSLPTWRPGTDYVESYSAHPEMGGGVVLDLIHEIDYVMWWFGQPSDVSAVVGHVSDLPFASEDFASMILRFPGGVRASIQLDYLRQPPRRSIEVVGSEGTLDADLLAGTLRLFQVPTGQWREESVESSTARNDMYVEEMQHLLQVVEGEARPLISLDDGVAALRVALAAKEASERGVTMGTGGTL